MYLESKQTKCEVMIASDRLRCLTYIIVLLFALISHQQLYLEWNKIIGEKEDILANRYEVIVEFERQFKIENE